MGEVENVTEPVVNHVDSNQSGSDSMSGLSKLEELRNQFRTKIVAEKEQKLKYLNRKEHKRKVTINGFVEEFSPSREKPTHGVRYDSSKEALKSPGLGQRMQTDLLKFAKQPSQKDLEVKRRQAILDSLHRKENDRKKVDNSYPSLGYKQNAPSRSFKNQLPPIPGSHKKQADNTEKEAPENNVANPTDAVENENPFNKKPAMIRRKPLPGVKTKDAEEGWTSENTSDKENTQLSQMSTTSPRVSAIQESDRFPLQESRSSNNDSAGATGTRQETERTIAAGDETIRDEQQTRTSVSSQSRRSVTVKDVIKIAENVETEQADTTQLAKGNKARNRGYSAFTKTIRADDEVEMQKRPESTHIVSDTLTDLENGDFLDIEKQRQEALQRVNRNSPAIFATRKQSQSKPEILVTEVNSKHGDSGLGNQSNMKSPEIFSDSDIMPVTERSKAAQSLRRTESHRSTKSSLKPGPYSQQKRPGLPGATLTEAAATAADKPKPVSPLSANTISEMRRREKELIDRIRKQQEELEIVRKQRYRQERMHKTATQRRTDKSDSESSRMVSTEDGSDTDMFKKHSMTPRATTGGNPNTESGDLTTRSFHLPDSQLPASQKQATKPKLPPKRSLDIKEDPYYAQIASQSTPQKIEMVKCEFCQRGFAPDRLVKHEVICESTSNKKRTQFETEKHRLKGTGAEMYISQDEEPKQPVVHSGQAKHPNTMVKCNLCGKQYAHHTADRHLSTCKKNKQQITDKTSGGTEQSMVASTSNIFVERV